MTPRIEPRLAAGKTSALTPVLFRPHKHFYTIFILGPNLSMLRIYSYLCTQESLTAVHGKTWNVSCVQGRCPTGFTICLVPLILLVIVSASNPHSPIFFFFWLFWATSNSALVTPGSAFRNHSCLLREPRFLICDQGFKVSNMC